jgi:hypothetical protein
MYQVEPRDGKIANIARIAIVGIVVILISCIGFALFFHHSVVRPAAARLKEEPDAAFAAELAAMTLAVGKIAREELDDDMHDDGGLEDDEEFLEYLKNNKRSCSSSWKTVAKCYQKYRKGTGEPVSLAAAREHVEVVGLRVAGFKKRISGLLGEARDLPAKTKDARAFKGEIVDLFKTLKSATVYDYMIEGGKVQVALDDMDDKGRAWSDSALERNPDVAKMLVLPDPLLAIALADLAMQPETRQYVKLIETRIASADEMDEAPCSH